MSSVPTIQTQETFLENRLIHSDTDFWLLGDVEGPDDVFEDDPFENGRIFFRVDVPMRFDYFAKEKSFWESSQSYFWDFIGYIWQNKLSSKNT